MGLFSGKKKETVALIDINSASVGGAYAVYNGTAAPMMYYTVRVPISLHHDEKLTQGMERALADVIKRMVTEGAPILHKETGSGHASRVVASVASPWQETHVHVDTTENTKPFTFTKALLESAALKAHTYGPDRTDSGTTVISTILNGYEVPNPFGKRVTKASIVTLSSTIEKEVGQKVQEMLRQAYHTHTSELSGFAPAAYTVFRDLYPHQKDFIVLEISGSTTDAIFVKHGILVGVTSAPYGIRDLVESPHRNSQILNPTPGVPNTDRTNLFSDKVRSRESDWLLHIKAIFSEFAKEHALPRTVFLIADAASRDFLKRLLDDTALRALWLSDDPLSITPVLAEHFAPYIHTRGEAVGDTALAILALHDARRASSKIGKTL